MPVSLSSSPTPSPGAHSASATLAFLLHFFHAKPTSNLGPLRLQVSSCCHAVPPDLCKIGTFSTFRSLLKPCSQRAFPEHLTQKRTSHYTHLVILSSPIINSYLPITGARADHLTCPTTNYYRGRKEVGGKSEVPHSNLLPLFVHQSWILCYHCCHLTL